MSPDSPTSMLAAPGPPTYVSRGRTAMGWTAFTGSTAASASTRAARSTLHRPKGKGTWAVPGRTAESGTRDGMGTHDEIEDQPAERRRRRGLRILRAARRSGSRAAARDLRPRRRRRRFVEARARRKEIRRVARGRRDRRGVVRDRERSNGISRRERPLLRNAPPTSARRSFRFALGSRISSRSRMPGYGREGVAEEREATILRIANVSTSSLIRNDAVPTRW